MDASCLQREQTARGYIGTTDGDIQRICQPELAEKQMKQVRSFTKTDSSVRTIVRNDAQAMLSEKAFPGIRWNCFLRDSKSPAEESDLMPRQAPGFEIRLASCGTQPSRAESR